MQVSEIDNVKIYNLSVGKSLPDWLTERKKRALLKKNVDLRRRIELIQEFDMPGVSTNLRVSKDGQYIMATGIYKPRVKCYDVNNLSLKFERCLDSEVVTFEILSEDYSKLVFLQCDRYVEFHVGHGRHYRLRVPRFGRDIAYHKPSCDLFVVGASAEVYRLNLELGQFLAPYVTKANEINCCAVNEEHGLLILGTESGHVEAWDPRTKSRQGILDCALHCTDSEYRNDKLPAITAAKFDGPLRMGVGTSTGHVLLYDIRSSKPLLVKDHMNEIPIKALEFHKQMNYVYSMDSTVVKIWDKNTGKQYTSIESSADFNDLCVIPNTGLNMMAVEDQKMQIYYIPSLGPAPRWCAFLDNLTEELEGSASQTVYDDYKFITKQELESLGLDHLLGTNLLRAYMHGYFVDVRLYKRAKSIADPFAFEQYKKRKIREKIEQERPSRIKVEDNLPKVNRDLASKLMDHNGKKKKQSGDLLKDDRFKALFENPDFEVDKSAEEYRLINPVLSRKGNNKDNKPEAETVQMDEAEEKDSDMELYDTSDDESSDDDRFWVKEVKKQHKIIRKNKSQEEESQPNEEKVYEFNKAPNSTSMIKSITRVSKASLGDRLKSVSVHEEPRCLSKEEALACYVDAKSTSDSYKQMRKWSIKAGHQVFPSYYSVRQAKIECYPPVDKIFINETRAEITLQAVLNKTAERLISAQHEVLKSFVSTSMSSFSLVSKWGCDGSSGHSTYKQKFINTEGTDEFLFVFSFVPLQLRDNSGNVVWQNSRPSSTMNCRPIKFIFSKETKDFTVTETNKIMEEIKQLVPTIVDVEGNQVTVKHELLFTMVDGKVCNAMTETSSSQKCYICGATPKFMNDESREFVAKKENLSFGISPLHAWIRSFECLLHISYRLEVKKWQLRDESDKENVKQRSACIQARFKTEMGLIVDQPKPGFGNTNDGNTARRFFADPEKASDITGVDVTLINKFGTILRTLASGYDIDVDKFNSLTRDTRKLYLSLYSWYYMPVTVHKLLVHSVNVVKSAILPIGQLSEEAQEARNKDCRRFREHNTRKTSRIATNRDLLNMLLITSDPLINSLREVPKKPSTSKLPSEVLELIIAPTVNISSRISHSSYCQNISVSDYNVEDSSEHEFSDIE